MIAITSLLLVVTISLLITRVATVILTATGMSREVARFQARSAFTGTGFTTKEAEDALNHPIRRKVVATLMLLGSAGIVAAASTTIIGFRGGGIGRQWWRVLELALGLMVLVYLSRSKWIDRRLNAGISRLLARYTDLQTRDLAGLLDLSGDYSVSELAVDPGDWVAGRALGDLKLRDEGVVVLGVTRQNGRYVGAPTFATRVDAGDVLLVYGREAALAELDDRRSGAAGDTAHEIAVARQAHHEHGDEAASVARP